MSASRWAMAGCVFAMVITAGGTAPAGTAKPARVRVQPSFRAVQQVQRPVLGINFPDSVMVTKVESVVTAPAADLHETWVDITVENFSTGPADFKLHHDIPNYYPTETAVKLKAKESTVVRMLWDHAKICSTHGATYNVWLDGTGKLDTTKRKLHEPAPVFKIDGTSYGMTGAPPSNLDSQLRITHVSLPDGYACGKKIKAQVKVVNGTDIASGPSGLSVHMLDMPVVGAPAWVLASEASAPNIGDHTFGVGSHKEETITITSTSDASGVAGEISFHLHDVEHKFGGKLSYGAWAAISVYDATEGAWKIE